MDPEQIKALIAESIKEAMGQAAQIANDAATAHSKRLAKEFETKFESLKTAPPPPPPPDPKIDEKIAKDPVTAALQAQLKELSEKYTVSEERAKAAEKRSRDESAFNTLKSSLTGVKPELQDAAAQLLFHVEKRVQFDESGQPLFLVPQERGGLVEDVAMPLAKGVEFWVKSESAKPFLPAPGGNAGSGRGGKSPSPGSIPTGRRPNGIPVYDKPATTDAEKVARAGELEASLKALGITNLG